MQMIYIFSLPSPQISTLEDFNHNAPVYGKFHRHDRFHVGLSSFYDRPAATFYSVISNLLSLNEQPKPTTAAFGTTVRNKRGQSPARSALESLQKPLAHLNT